VYYELNWNPIWGRDGKVAGVTVFMRDISQRKLAEKRLLDSEERLRLALSAANQGIYDVNLLSGEMVVNDIYASMLGYAPVGFEESITRLFARIHPEDQALVQRNFEDCTRGIIPEYRVEFREMSAEGQWIWILSVGKVAERDTQGRPLRMLGTHTDITASKNDTLEIARLLAESQRRLERISALHKIDTAISSNTHLDLTLDILTQQVQSQLKVDALAILLFDEGRNEFRYAASSGFLWERIRNARVKLGSSFAGRAAEKGGLIRLKNDAGQIDPALFSLMQQEGFQDYYGLPLVSKGRLKGVLELFHRTVLEPDDEWLDYYAVLAGQAAIAIENSQLLEGLRGANEELLKAYDATIEGWSRALDLRDKETEGHTQRVMAQTLELARRMGISEAQLVYVRWGALLHDIGKLGVSDLILLKPGPLTDDEWVWMRKHPTYAYEMLSPIQYLGQAIDIPYYHHEKWDGTGYPVGLKGEQIPFTARIFAVIDMYDALTSDRPYRPAWTQVKTLTYIQSLAGKHLDPAVVEGFIAMTGATGD
jgi:putative nucleotidyltransferase with HDIG domain/PAS domain S-box-containing protein